MRDKQQWLKFALRRGLCSMHVANSNQASVSVLRHGGAIGGLTADTIDTV